MKGVLDLLDNSLLLSAVVRAGRTSSGRVARPRRMNVLGGVVGDRVGGFVALSASQGGVVARSILVTLERTRLVTVSTGSSTKPVSASELLVGGGEQSADSTGTRGLLPLVDIILSSVAGSSVASVLGVPLASGTEASAGTSVTGLRSVGVESVGTGRTSCGWAIGPGSLIRSRVLSKSTNSVVAVLAAVALVVRVVSGSRQARSLLPVHANIGARLT